MGNSVTVYLPLLEELSDLLPADREVKLLHVMSEERDLLLGDHLIIVFRVTRHLLEGVLSVQVLLIVRYEVLLQLISLILSLVIAHLLILISVIKWVFGCLIDILLSLSDLLL